MKVTVERTQLLKATKFASQIVPRNPIISTLSCLLIKTTPDGIVMSGTDMDILSNVRVNCKVEETGEMVVNAKRLLDIIREIKTHNVNIFADEETVIINPGESETKITGMPVSDFPDLNTSIEGDVIPLSNIDLATMIDKTSFSVAQDRTRLALTGVYWKIAPDKMIMVATDGYRLSLCEKQINIKTKESIETIVPANTISYVSFLLKNDVKLKTISKDADRILFDFDNVKVISKHIEGDYPDFRRVIPLENSKRVYVSSKKFIDVIQKMISITNVINYSIKMTISPNKMKLIAKNEDIGGESRESITIQYDGEPMTAGYNAVFLLEILKRIETDEVLLEFENPQTALIMKPVVKSRGVLFEMDGLNEYLYLLMPLRLWE